MGEYFRPKVYNYLYLSVVPILDNIRIPNIQYGYYWFLESKFKSCLSWKFILLNYVSCQIQTVFIELETNLIYKRFISRGLSLRHFLEIESI